MDKGKKIALIVFSAMILGAGIVTYVYYKKHIATLRAEADATVVTPEQFDVIVQQVAKNR